MADGDVEATASLEATLEQMCQRGADPGADQAAMDDLVRRKFDSDEARLASFYPDWADWPVAAQLGAHSMARAGAYLPTKWPKFNAVANSGDWAAVAAKSQVKEEGNPGVKLRNEANHRLLMNAAAVVAQGLDRSKIYYPNAL